MHRAVRLLAPLLILAIAMGTSSLLPLGGGSTRDASAANRPLVGFSFSPRTATWLGNDPPTALDQLMTSLTPDLVRLPIYWDAVEPARGTFDFREVDGLLAVVRGYNHGHASRPARVILEVGARNMGYPELYVPDWLPAAARSTGVLAVSDSSYGPYLETSIRRYRNEPLLYSWQLENEPLDNVPTTAGSPVNVPGDLLIEEYEAVKTADPVHPVVVTTYNSSTLSLDLAGLHPDTTAIPTSRALPAGHPLEALQLGDALGLDVYVVTGSTSLADATATVRTDWKRAALDYWGEQSRTMHKQLWITEMQGSPWPGHDDFTTADLAYSARRYRQSAAAVVLLWGVESWLGSPEWMTAGVQARHVLGT